jgi:TolB-like protein
MPKAFDLLLVLIQNRGKVLDRDKLMSEVWPNTHVENTNLNVNLSMLRKVLGEKPRDHRYIVTIPGKGYKFVAAVTAAEEENTEHWKESSAKLLPFAEGIRKKWIAVLPFSWVGRRPGDDWLGLGITESLTVDLARIPQLRVQLTDRAVGWTARRRSVVATERKGDVDYLLQGRIQRLDGKIRVTVQLISARNGQLLWARKFDGLMTNGFRFQDNISAETTREVSRIVETRTSGTAAAM